MTTTTTEITKPDRPTIFSITEAMRALVDRFEDETDTEVSPDEIAAQFAALEGEFSEKVAGCIAYLRTQSALEAALKDEAKRLRDRAGVHARRQERLEEALMFVLDAQGRSKVETRLGTLSIANNGGKLAIDLMVPPEHLPPEYTRTVVEADTDALRARLEAGGPITVETEDGVIVLARLKPRGRSVRVK